METKVDSLIFMGTKCEVDEGRRGHKQGRGQGLEWSIDNILDNDFLMKWSFQWIKYMYKLQGCMLN